MLERGRLEGFEEFNNMLDALEFNKAKHKYKLFGTSIPSVTTIINKKKGIPNAIRNDPKFQMAMEFGNFVHECTEFDDLGKERPMEIMDDVYKSADMWKEFLDTTGAKVIGVEVPVYDAELWYCGTIDRFIELDGKIVIIDLKTSAICTKHRYQIAAYVEAARWMGVPVDKGLAVSFKGMELNTGKVFERNYKKWREILSAFNDGEFDE